MKVATWNVNGIRKRSSEVLSFIDREEPDVLCLQETKASREQVPEPVLDVAGYHVHWHGLSLVNIALTDRRARADRSVPTIWDAAVHHAAARANVVYIREPRGVARHRRRDGEPSIARLARLYAGEHQGIAATITAADAPTWVALQQNDPSLPAGSAGYVHGATPTAAFERIAELISGLAREGVTRA